VGYLLPMTLAEQLRSRKHALHLDGSFLELIQWDWIDS
jgi:hypothetical protein